MAETVRNYVATNTAYRALVFVHSSEEWQIRFIEACRHLCGTIKLRFLSRSDKELAKLPIEIQGKKSHLLKSVKRRRIRKS
jgi:hypothetical protein